MRVRDAVEADADAMAAIADGPTDVMRNLVHDRTVRVAEIETMPEPDGAAETDAGADSDAGAASDDAADTDDAADADDTVDADDTADADVVGNRGDAGVEPHGSAGDAGRTPLEALAGFVSFDAKSDVVHVTQIDGSPEACELLLGEPVRFAETEGMRVELLVTDPDGHVASAAEALGFERDGPGPRFDGESTVRYGFQPT